MYILIYDYKDSAANPAAGTAFRLRAARVAATRRRCTVVVKEESSFLQHTLLLCQFDVQSEDAEYYIHFPSIRQ